MRQEARIGVCDEAEQELLPGDEQRRRRPPGRHWLSVTAGFGISLADWTCVACVSAVTTHTGPAPSSEKVWPFTASRMLPGMPPRPRSPACPAARRRPDGRRADLLLGDHLVGREARDLDPGRLMVGRASTRRCTGFPWSVVRRVVAAVVGRVGVVAPGLAFGPPVSVFVTTSGAGGCASPGPKRQARRTARRSPRPRSARPAPRWTTPPLRHRPLAPPAEQLVVVPRAEARGVLVDEQAAVQPEVARVGAQEPPHVVPEGRLSNSSSSRARRYLARIFVSASTCSQVSWRRSRASRRVAPISNIGNSAGIRRPRDFSLLRAPLGMPPGGFP